MNLSVMQRELDCPTEHMLVSTTDNKGIMTHCNRALVAVSGYSFKELICQNHNMLCQSDMPEIAFKDRLSTIGRNNPWTVVVKNPGKNGDHCLVEANVTPILENDNLQSYLSVRIKPMRAQIEGALRANECHQSHRPTAVLFEGRLGL